MQKIIVIFIASFRKFHFGAASFEYFLCNFITGSIKIEASISNNVFWLSLENVKISLDLGHVKMCLIDADSGKI